MIASKSAAQAKEYYTSSLAQTDYYISQNRQELPGRFYGRLTERLGLKGQAVTRDAFFALCENSHPGTGKQLTPRMKEERITGYDINFHCPKSVSILHALSQDDHILKAFKGSVLETMQEIEGGIKTRVRQKGVYDDRETGEMVFAEFTHQTARPVKGHTPDVHLHSHCFVFNATWDDTEKRFKAGKFRDIKRDMRYYQAQFHKRLADKMIDLGYQVRRTPSAFEIEGVPQQVIDHFSKRTNEIGQAAKEKGITDAKALSELGARTRAKKQKGLTMAELKADWRRQMRKISAGITMDQTKPVRHAPVRPQRQMTAQDCIDHAKRHCFERASVVPDKKILEVACRHALGHTGISVEDIANQFKQDRDFLHIKRGEQILCTTKEVLAEEKRMVELARAGQGRLAPLYKDAPDLTLNDQQAEAVRHVLTTGNRVSIIRGAAGTGKTTLMREAVNWMEKAGKKIFVVAPTAQASRGVLKEEGFESAETVAKFLSDPDMQNNLAGNVLWVDEAGLMGTKDMLKVMELVTEKNARLILGGDTRQHSAVVRGDALRILNSVGQIKTAEVSRIYRQKNSVYREAVQNLADGNIKEAFGKLEQMEAIKTIDPLNPLNDLVKDYTAALKAGKSALVVSPTHKEGDRATVAIREKLRKEGMIGKKEIIADRYTNLSLTDAEKTDIRNFKEGQIIQFNQNRPGVSRGSVWSVQAVHDHAVIIENKQGKSLALPSYREGDFDVFHKSEIALSKGDRVMITRNGFDSGKKRLVNGSILEVVSVHEKNGVTLRNPYSKARYQVDKDFGHINHAHVVTSYASQGKTVDQVYIHQPAATFPATDLKQFYVSVSRGRDNVTLYTDDKAELLEHASEIGDRQSALETLESLHDQSVDRMQKTHRPEPEKDKTKDLAMDRSMGISYEPEF